MYPGRAGRRVETLPTGFLPSPTPASPPGDAAALCCADLPRASLTWGPRVEGHRERWQPTPDEAGSNRLPPPCTRVCDPLPLPAPEQDAAFAMSTAAGKCQQPAAALLLQAVTIFPCICPGLDASPPASTHELTIPNDVSTVAIPLPVCVCVCTYIYIYVYICTLQMYELVKYI